jgi:EAL and modified HD-GYP domain-containing signal transduction protein
MGIDYFQGDFLSKPELVEKQQFSSSKVNMLELMAETSKKRLDFETIRTIIFRDVLLSFKLLKFMDSPAFGLSNSGKIKSLGHALTYLGETEFRKFISLVAMASIGEDKPPALVSLAAVRARFCEFLAHELGNKADADSAFLCGLMSLIDAVMNEPIETIFLKLPIDRAIKDAIKGDESEIGTILKLAVAYENGEWRQVEEHARQLNIEELTLGSNYRNAIYWARSFENAFSDSGAPQK